MPRHLISMSLVLGLGLFIGTTLAETAFAETAATAPDTQCPLTGPKDGLTEECSLLRATFRADLSACMKDLKIKAAARTNEVYADTAHASRARMLICDRQVRDRMGLAN